jgi:hypothetical protein
LANAVWEKENQLSGSFEAEGTADIRASGQGSGKCSWVRERERERVEIAEIEEIAEIAEIAESGGRG